MSEKKTIRIALAGTPNAGKSSVFNHLTGLRQHVGNYPGVTVDKKLGHFKVDGKRVNVIDLPGTHSLYPVSDDERVVLNVLLDKENTDRPDLVIFIANGTNLQRSLLLMTQISDLGYPVICCVNMLDLAEEDGLEIDLVQLQKKLGLPVMKLNGRTGEGIDSLKQACLDVPPARSAPFTGMPPDRYHSYLTQVNNKHLDHDPEPADRSDKAPIVMEVEDKTSRLDVLYDMVKSSTRKTGQEPSPFTSKVDRVLTHNVWGTLIFLGILFTMFQAIFSLAATPMDWIDQGFAALAGSVAASLPDTMWSSLLTDGVLAGIGGIVIFIPQIAILFGLVAVLEQSGYMTRAVYLSDNLMKHVGLNGRSLVALISGVACAVPAVMSARTISNWKERMITIFVTPFISCSARIPVYVVLIGFVVPANHGFGIINSQGLVMMGLYLLGVFAAIGSAWVLSKIMKSKERSILMLELPRYQWPQWKSVGITMWEKSKIFVWNAGRVIFVVSIILWALASFGPGDEMTQVRGEVEAHYEGTDTPEEVIENEIAAKELEASYAGHIGKFMEPAIEPLGFDWKIGIALVTSFAAREVFVGTMATIYSSASADDEASVIERMRSQTTIDGEPLYNRARSMSLLMFYVFALQCMSTVAIVKRETKSWLIAIAQFVAMTAIAYLASFITYSILA